MTEEEFFNRQQELLSKINELLDNSVAGSTLERSLKTVGKILSIYNYPERNKYKGWLTRAILDSLELDFVLSEELIVFDRSL